MKFGYFGYGNPQVYPGAPHPEGGQLSARPGDILEFGEASPPNDGAWYAVGDDGLPVHYVADPPPVPKLDAQRAE